MGVIGTRKQIKKWGIIALTVIMIFTTFPLDVLFASYEPETDENDVAYGYELDEMVGEEMLLDNPADINTGEEVGYPPVEPEVTMPAVAPEVDHTPLPEATYPNEDEDDPIAAAPLSTPTWNLNNHVTVNDWDLLNSLNPRSSIFDMEFMPSGLFYFEFSWTVDAPEGDFLQEGDSFRLARPNNPVQGDFMFTGQTWQDFTDEHGVVIGQWRIQSNHIEVVFNSEVDGMTSVSGSFRTDRTIGQDFRLGGERYITFGGIPKLLNVRQATLGIVGAVQNKWAVTSSTSQVSWALDAHIVGVRQVTGQYWDTPGEFGNMTPVPGFWVEDTLEPGTHISSITFVSNLNPPHSFDDPTSPTYGFAGNASIHYFTFTSFMNRIYQEGPSETYADFRARVGSEPFQWGIWTDPVNDQETFVAYFGTLGEDGPRMSEVNPNFARVAAQAVINNGFYPESYLDDLTDYFWEVFGDDNSIGGRIPFVRIRISQQFAPVSVQTPVSNTMTVTRNGVTQDSTGTGTLRPSEGGGGVVPPAAARLTLTDQITEAPLAGASFQLQIQSGSNWNNVANGSWTTNSDGEFTTRVLPNGTYRFIQTSTPTAPYYHIPSSNGFNSALDTVVSAEFQIVGGTDGASVEVENIRRFAVTYVLQNSQPNASENVIHMDSPDNVPAPTRTGHVFLGWATTSNATSGFLEASDIEDMVVEGNLRFYAIWRAYPTITKAANVSDAAIGDTIEYTITVNNSNNHVVPGEFTVVDVIDLDLVEFVEGSVQLNGEEFNYNFNEETGELRVILEPLAMGATVITFEVIVREEAAGETVVNVAVLETPGDSDFPPTLITPEVEVEIDPLIEPTIAKAANRVTAAVSDVIEYTITVTNGNQIPLTGDFVVVDVLDLDLVDFVVGSVLVDGEEVDYNFNEATGELRVILNPLAAGQTEVTFEVVVRTEAAGATITNVAILEVPEDSDLPNPPPTPPVDVEVYPGPSISKAANVSSAEVGDIIEYTITVNNPDSSALEGDFVVVDVLDLDFVEFIAGSVEVNGTAHAYDFDADTGELRVTLNPLASGNTVVTFEVEILPAALGETILNVAVLELPEDSDLPEPPPTPPVEVEVIVLPPTITKAANRGSAEVGDTIEYTITVNNPNTTALPGDFVVVDMIDLSLVDFVAGSVEVNGTAHAYNFNATTGELRVVLNPLAVGNTNVTFDVVVREDAAGETVTNVAVLEVPEDSDFPTPPPTPPVDVEIYPEDPDVLRSPTITKEANVTTAEVGDTITYRITVNNPNDEPLEGEFVVVDEIDISLVDFVAGSVRVNGEVVAYNFNSTTGELRVILDPLAVGTTNVTFDVVVREDAAGETVVNVAVLEIPEDGDFDFPPVPPTPPVDVEVEPEVCEDPEDCVTPTLPEEECEKNRNLPRTGAAIGSIAAGVILLTSGLVIRLKKQKT